MIKLSVIVCSHNPRECYLERVLTALQRQTLPLSDWELIVVDNASRAELSWRFDLSWHPNGRHVREEKLGLTHARLRGIAETAGELLVYIDDDNIAAPHYLSEALLIGERYAFLGAWGGSISGEFEVAPAPWAIRYLPHLAIRTINQIRWSNDVNDWPATPMGAGLCVRRNVAELYKLELLSDGTRVKLDRRGSSLDGAGDLDLAYTSSRLGLGWGTFPTLDIVHLMPDFRTTKEYLLRITEASSASLVVFGRKVGRLMPARMGSVKLIIRGALIFHRDGWIHVQFFLAQQQGIRRGYKNLIEEEKP